MLFIKLIESLCNTRIHFRYFNATYYKNGSAKYRKLIEYFSQNLGSVKGSFPLLTKGILAVLIFTGTKFRS